MYLVFVADCIAQTITRIPDRGKLGLIDSLKLYSCDCAMNAAVDLKKLGADVSVLGDEKFEPEYILTVISKFGRDSEDYKNIMSIYEMFASNMSLNEILFEVKGMQNQRIII